MGFGSIPWTAVDRYAEREGLTSEEDYEEFKYMMREMDYAWLEYQNEKAEANKSKNRADYSD